MKKTHKITLLLLLTVALCFVIVCLCACTNGTDGINGTNGQDGQNGKDGVNGKSAYEIWLDEGYTGSQPDFLNWLKGDTGSQGSTGNTGEQGPQGEQGLKGETGDKGQDGNNGLSAYEIFIQQYPYYNGNEIQWINSLINGELHVYTITFKSEVSDDIVKYALKGYPFEDIPTVPEKEGQTSAEWNVKDFSNITTDMEVIAIYDMRKYVTFHNEFTNDEDITITVNYGESITNVPVITTKVGNKSKWSVTDFSYITIDMQVEAIYETQGLHFTLNNQGTEYSVTSDGESNEPTIATTIEEIFIPSNFNEKPVTVVSSLNVDYNNNVKFVYIPEGVREIGENAFLEWKIITTVILPNSLTTIGDCAFNGCSSLTNIVLPNSITTMGHSIFAGCDFSSINMPDDITVIKRGTFGNCDNLTSIIISSKTTIVEDGAFNSCGQFKTIYFKGTQKEYNISFVDDVYSWNDIFTNATVYYYSQTQPSDSGNYWHYDTDGITPIIWEKEN